MYQKQITYIALISLKSLFNMEHEISEQLLIVGILSMVCMKQVISEVAKNFTLQVEEAATFVKYAICCMKEQMRNSENNYKLQAQHLHI